MANTRTSPKPGCLTGVRVVEMADEQGEYTGRLFAGLGADVIKVEPPGGSATRDIGPFLNDSPDREGSLYFWNYNLGKRSVVIDLVTEQGKQQMLDLLATADVFLESTPRDYLASVGLTREGLLKRFPSLIIARMSAFGDSGPWADYKASDLVHLALGGVMMNCGYDPEPNGTESGIYDTPPIAPQMWHAYSIAGIQLAIVTLGALLHRDVTGEGQILTGIVHNAVSNNPEMDSVYWIYQRLPIYRQTSRHARAVVDDIPNIVQTRDGRWIMPGAPMPGRPGWDNLLKLLGRYGMAGDLPEERYAGMKSTAKTFAGGPGIDRESANHIHEVIWRLIRKLRYEQVPWREAQEGGMLWVPLRKPHENALDEHWQARKTFAEVQHEDLGRSFVYATSRWMATETDWQTGPRPPHTGEHTQEVLAPLAKAAPPTRTAPAKPINDSRRSRWGKPFALHGVQVLDFTWYLASGGAPRFLSSMGATILKVEWKDSPDIKQPAFPPGGREARRKATGPLPTLEDQDLSGHQNNRRPGQRAISLNLRHPQGLAIAKRLAATSDIVAEGFSPGVMDRLGLGYDALRAIKPDIIYAQQSGMGAQGVYGRYRSLGPIANSLSGLSEMSGFPEPYPPAGWGYSYCDWEGAYNFALAMMAALVYRDRTGKGQWIDSSQCETGMFLAGVPLLDWSANNRVWRRYGNRSPYKPAAPHGAYRCQGNDRWIAIACFTEAEWQALTEVADKPGWRSDPRFATLASRLASQDALDALVGEWTAGQERYGLMHRLQGAGVPAGVCQTAEDRCDDDPQLRAQNWLTEVTGTKMGTWPVIETPVKASATPPFAVGELDRAAPFYGEDNEYVYGEMLGMDAAEIKALAHEGVI